MQCTQMLPVRTKSGRIAKPERFERCIGELEASSRIFLDVEAVPVDENEDDRGFYSIVLTSITPSRLNDHYDGFPCNLESEFTVSCAECGHEYAADLNADVRAKMGLQPIGDAERTLGLPRGGR